MQALHGTHGDAPRVVPACTDVEDCFHATVEAFNISEEFQLPVLVLSDQAVGQRKETVSADRFVHEVRDRIQPTAEELESYERYRDTASGVSPMSIPGTRKGMYQTNGLEHNAQGRPDSLYLTHETMNAKRFRKLWPIRERYHTSWRYGPERAVVGVLYAPKSGRETREDIRMRAEEGRDYIVNRARQTREQAQQWVDKGREILEQQKDQIRSAFEAGKGAYRDATGQADEQV
jgi:2-oxoglutarate ferredoxin oxidoreductase subunit alpha